jgi:hypothetical protein
MKRFKAWWSAGWRVAVCLLLLFWIFHSIFLNEGRLWAQREGLQWEQMSRGRQWHLAWTRGPQDLWHTLCLVHPGALLLSLLLIGLALWLGVVRWRLVLKTQGLELSLARATRISLVAQFFNAFLLGSTGGDLIKAYYAARETHHLKTEAVTTVFVDRLVGLWAMLLFAGMMMLPNLQLLRRHKEFAVPAFAILVMLAALSIVLSLAFWGGVSKRLPRARHYLRRLPKGELLERSLDSCRQFGKEKTFLAKAIALSLVVNIVCVLQIYVLGRGLDMGVTFTAMLMIVPIITCIAAVPITPNGLGLRENLYVIMLAAILVPGPVALLPSLPASQESQELIAKARTAALSLSLLASAEGIFWSLIGGVVYMGLRQKEHLAEVTHETANNI